jgi:hypothetical protein
LPKAIEWARKQEEIAEKEGSSLRDKLVEVARRVGVQQPDSVRLMTVDRLPQPDDPELQEAAQQTGLLGPGMVGLTLGYAIFIVKGHETIRLISHECRHVYQYEQYGSIDDFLPNYLGQVVAHGYRNAPLEIDARNHEIQTI